MIDDPHLTDIEVEMALDDQLPPQRSHHVKQCDTCAARIDHATHEIQTLKTRLYRQTCPSPDTLARFEARELEPELQQKTRFHVEGCPRCQEELAVMRQYLYEADEDRTPTRFQRAAYPRLTQRARADRSAAAALRGTNKSRTLNFDISNVHIFLEILDQGHKIALSGQIIAPAQDEWDGALVRVKHENAPVGLATTNDMGEFQVDIARVSSINIRMTNREGESIIIEGVNL